MKTPTYPFDPSTMDALPEELAELFRGLELTLLKIIVERIKKAGQINQVGVEAIKALRAHGITLDEIKQAVADTVAIGAEKLDALLDDVVEWNRKYYRDMVTLAKVTEPEHYVDERDIAAIRRQTWGAYRNITGSMGFMVVQKGRLKLLEPAAAYQHALDSALLQVQSGVVSYETAIADAVRKLADSGLKSIDFESGAHRQLDSHIRTCVMTGVNQLNQKYREQSMDYLETDLVECSAHLGARNIDGPNGWENHEKWQGGVYRWDGHGTRTQNATPKDKQTPPRYEDITRRWYPDATPQSHNVEDANEVTVNGVTYKVDGRNVQLTYSAHEKEIAELLEREVGGELKMLPRVNNPQGVSTPDYLFHGKGYDLKTLGSGAGKNTIYNRIKKSREQAVNFIVDVTKSGLEEPEITEQIEKIFRMKETSFVDEVIIVNGDKIVRVVKRA